MINVVRLHVPSLIYKDRMIGLRGDRIDRWQLFTAVGVLETGSAILQHLDKEASHGLVKSGNLQTPCDHMVGASQGCQAA